MQNLSVQAKYEFFTPNTLAVLTTITSLPAPSSQPNSGNVKVPPETILVQASILNVGTVYLGATGVTAAAGAGIELSPGGSFELPTRDYTKWRAIAAATGNVLQVMYLNGEL
jgi:hypothetical protein